MKETLTKRQNDVYNFIVNYMKENLISPTVREICDGVGLKSTSSAYSHIKCLQKHGLITIRECGPRTIRLIGYKLVKDEDEDIE